MVEPLLDGVRVLDLSQYLPGPSATQMLADMGADVIKIEPPQGDPLLGMSPLTGGRDGLPFYKAVNAGKSVLRIDLKSEEGRAGFTTLLERADVVLESYRPGVMERLGFPPDVLENLNPRLVYLALTGYGQMGPKSLEGGHDINYMAITGGLSVTGTPDRPVAGWPPAADYAAALNSVNAILAAYIRCLKTGKGAYIDLAMADTYMAWQPWGLTGEFHADAMSLGNNLLNGGAACYGIYETADGRFLTLGALEPKFWANFCRCVGHEDWTARQGETLPQTALIDEVSALLASKPLSHWEKVLEDADCCYQAVLSYGEAAEHPQNLSRRQVRNQPDHCQVVWAPHVDGEPMADRPDVQELDIIQSVNKWS